MPPRKPHNMNDCILAQHQSFISKLWRNFKKILFVKKSRTSSNVLFILRCSIEGNLRPKASHRSFLLFWLRLTLFFTPRATPLVLPIESPSIARFYIAAMLPFLYTGSLFIFYLRTPIGFVCSFVRFRENGWKNSAVETDDLEWRRKERSTLIKVASVLFFSFSLSSCFSRGRILAIFPEKNANRTYLSPLDSPPEHLRSQSNMKVIWFCNTFTSRVNEQVDWMENNLLFWERQRFSDLIYFIRIDIKFIGLCEKGLEEKKSNFQVYCLTFSN